MSLSRNNNEGSQEVTEAKNIHLQEELDTQQREVLRQVPRDIAKILQEGTDDLGRSGLAASFDNWPFYCNVYRALKFLKTV